MMRHVPNLLSFARLAAAPYVCWLLAGREYGAALVWMFVIGATDGLDGYLARRFDVASRLGAMLDPVADKALLGGAYLTLALTGAIPAWLAWLVLGRDAAILLVAAGFLLLAKSRPHFPPTLAGKLSTAFQILFIFAVTAAGAGLASDTGAVALQWVVLLVTGWSGLDYARRALSTRA